MREEDQDAPSNNEDDREQHSKSEQSEEDI